MCLSPNANNTPRNRDALRLDLRAVVCEVAALTVPLVAFGDGAGLVERFDLTPFEVLEAIQHFEDALRAELGRDIVLDDPDDESAVTVGSLLDNAEAAIAAAFKPETKPQATESQAA